MSRTERSRRTSRQSSGHLLRTVADVVTQAERVSVERAESRTESLIDEEVRHLLADWEQEEITNSSLDGLAADVRAAMRRLLKRVSEASRGSLL